MPPFLATLAGKAIAVLVIAGLAFSVGLYEGCAIKQQAWDAAIARQAQASAHTVIRGGENTAKVITKYVKARDNSAAVAEARAATLQKELDAYVQTHPVCPVPDAVVRVFDDPPADRVSATPDPAGGTPDPGEAVTTVGVLQALADYRDLYTELALRNEALIEWVKTSYEIQKEGAGR
jgi:hypothetical protein